MSATIVAACGKGGVGKSVFIAACIRVLSQNPPSPPFDKGSFLPPFDKDSHSPPSNKDSFSPPFDKGGEGGFPRRFPRILAIDADPALGLSQLLGMDRSRPTIGGVRDQLISGARESKTKEALAESFEYMLTESLIETDTFDFLAMGHSRFKGCFCPVNRLLREAVEALAENYDVAFIDAEAGLEQVYREVMRHVDHLALLVDCSRRSVETAQQLLRSGKELGMDCLFGAVVNRFDTGESGTDPQFGSVPKFPGSILLEEAGIPVWGTIPEDGELRENDKEGKTIFELSPGSPVIENVRKIVGNWGQTPVSRN